MLLECFVYVRLVSNRNNVNSNVIYNLFIKKRVRLHKQNGKEETIKSYCPGKINISLISIYSVNK